MGILVAYPYSLYFSEQLSCIKYFHLNYGLKDIEFQILNHFKLISGILLFNKSNMIHNSDYWMDNLTCGAYMS